MHPLEKALDYAIRYAQSLPEPWGHDVALPLTVVGMALGAPRNDALAAIRHLLTEMDTMGCPCDGNDKRVHVIDESAHPMVHKLGIIAQAATLEVPKDPGEAMIYEVASQVAQYLALCIINKNAFKLQSFAKQAHRAGYPIASAVALIMDPSFDTSSFAPVEH